MYAKIICDVGDDRCRIAPARLEKDIMCEDSFAHGSYSSIDFSESFQSSSYPETLIPAFFWNFRGSIYRYPKSFYFTVLHRIVPPFL